MPKVINKMFKVDLQLFNDGGATGGADGFAAIATENAPKTDDKMNGSSRRSKSGEFDNVVFGKQEGTTSNEATGLDTEGNPTGAGKTDVLTTSNTLEERKKAFNDLINGEYKDLYQEEFQRVFDRRFKQVKGMEADLAAQKPILDKLMSRYGVSDVAELDKALMEDTEYWERVADEHGMTVEQYMAVEKIKMENAEMKANMQKQKNQEMFNQQLDKWYQEGERLKDIYPSFDFRQEVQNKEFLNLLKYGNTVEHAYQIIHFEELTQAAARAAAQTADAQAQARIKQKASRPAENGISSQSAAIVKDNVANLTRKERAEIAKRVARGEKIVF